jgi:hypothetical protein
MAPNASDRPERIGEIALDNECTFEPLGSNEYKVSISGATSVPKLLGDLQASGFKIMSIGWNTQEITVTTDAPAN